MLILGLYVFNNICTCMLICVIIYVEGDTSLWYLDPGKISVGDLKVSVVELCYGGHRVRKLHLRKQNVAFDEALVPLENDEYVCYPIGLLMHEPFVTLYVEHDDIDNWINMSNVVGVKLKVMMIS